MAVCVSCLGEGRTRDGRGAVSRDAMVRPAAPAAAALLLLLAVILPLGSAWLLEGLVGSWVVPDVQGGHKKRTEPERTEPLQLPPEEQDQESDEHVPLSEYTVACGNETCIRDVT